MPPQPADTRTPGTCPSCGAAVSGNYCSQCGTAMAPRPCPSCGTAGGPGARFCHRCGTPLTAATGPGGREPLPSTGDRGAWIVAATIIVVAIGAIVWRVTGPSAPVPAGGGIGVPPVAAGTAPDISQMSPMERFIRLNDRIMAAAEQGDSTTVQTFLPMALAAYDQLPTVDTDARYHAGLLRAQGGDLVAARAIADTILRAEPGNLIGLALLGAIADLAGDAALRAEALRRFRAAWDTEIGKPNPEYLDHRNVLDAFRAGTG